MLIFLQIPNYSSLKFHINLFIIHLHSCLSVCMSITVCLQVCLSFDQNAGQTYQPENKPFFALMHTNEKHSGVPSAKNVNTKPPSHQIRCLLDHLEPARLLNNKIFIPVWIQSLFLFFIWLTSLCVCSVCGFVQLTARV